MSAAIKVLYSGGTAEITEKKSRFIANVFSVSTEDEAQGKIAVIKKNYYDARHNCFAYTVGDTNPILRFGDDGEPSGTAGKPILEVISGAGLHNCLIVVTRYFGGTLLGTGGLIRAYTGAAKEGLSNSEIIEKKYGSLLSIKTDYNGSGKLTYLLANDNIPVIDTVYSDTVEITAMAEQTQLFSLLKKITDATNAKAVLTVKDELYFAEKDGEVIIFKKSP